MSDIWEVKEWENTGYVVFAPAKDGELAKDIADVENLEDARLIALAPTLLDELGAAVHLIFEWLPDDKEEFYEEYAKAHEIEALYKRAKGEA